MRRLEAQTVRAFSQLLGADAAFFLRGPPVPGVAVSARWIRSGIEVPPLERFLRVPPDGEISWQPAGGGVSVVAVGDGFSLVGWAAVAPVEPPGQALEALRSGLGIVKAARRAFLTSRAQEHEEAAGRLFAAAVASLPDLPGTTWLSLLRSELDLPGAALLNVEREARVGRVEVADGVVVDASAPETLHPASGLGSAAAEGAWAGPLEALGLPGLGAAARRAGAVAASAGVVRRDGPITLVLVSFLRRPVEEGDREFASRVAGDLGRVHAAAVRSLRGRRVDRTLERATAIMRAASGAVGLRATAEALAGELVTQLGVESCRVWRIEGDRWRCEALVGPGLGRRGAGAPGGAAVRVSWPVPVASRPWSEISAEALNDEVRPLLAPRGVSDVMLAPFGHSPGPVASPLGLVVVGRRAATTFDPVDGGLLTLAARFLEEAATHGLALERAVAERDDLLLVNAAREALDTAGATPRPLDATARRIADWSGARAVLLLEADPRGWRPLGASLPGGEEAPAVVETAGGPLAPWLKSAGIVDVLPEPGAEAFASILGFAPSGLVGVAPPADAAPPLRMLLAWADPYEAPGEELRTRLVGLVLALGRLVTRDREVRDEVAAARRLRAAQEDLVARQRLVALGEAAAIVAHEIRTPLGAIYNSLGQLATGLDIGPPHDRHVGIIREEIHHLNATVHELLELARPLRPVRRPRSLRQVVSDAVATAEAGEQTRRGTRFTAATVIEVDPRLPELMLDDRLLRHALVHLLVNAYEATKHAGNVRVQADVAGKGAELRARLVVSDDGPGVPPDQREVVFEPFRTTKASGTGLGLAMVRRIVEGHGGTIRCGEGAAGGAAFVLELPVAGPA